MAELCHVCDLFRTALFGPTNSNEDHLDDGQGNDLPRPMADAPATLGVRSRARPSSTRITKTERNPDAVAQPSGGSGATATPSVTSEVAAPVAAIPAAAAVAVAEPSKRGAAVESTPAPEAPAVKPAPKTKFSKRASRGLKSPAYMSFDDVDIEDDDSDGELFVEDRRASGSRSPSASASAYSVKQNVPSVYREPDLTGSVVKTVRPPSDDAPAAPASHTSYKSRGGADRVEGGVPETDGTGVRGPSETGASGGQDVGPGSSMETFPTASGGNLIGLSNSGLVGDRASIPRDESTLESARPHVQSESFHGYKGYPGYEPDTPVAESLAVGHSETTESLTINPGADVVDVRNRVKGGHMAPTPSSARHDPLAESAVPSDYSYLYGEANEHHPQAPASPGAEGMDHYGQVQVTSTRQQQQQQQHYHPQPQTQYHHQQQHQQYQQHAGPGMSYGSHATGVSYRDRESPAHSAAGSMTSSFRRDESSRNIQQVPSEDGMGSVLGTIAGTEDSQNEDLQWKRSALKKFHKVMVKGEGLRVVKHNRSGGSQVRIIRYDPEIKALVWNSKRYMKKAGSANVPIVGIKRVGREGNTVSVTAAGRGTIGFEPQRIRDAKILAEALRALVDKEERSAMWRG